MIFRFLAFYLGLVVWASCASSNRSVSGGLEDRTPPKIDSSRYSTPNKSVNFKQKNIVFTFDEWVAVNASAQVSIQPHTENPPTLAIKHKSLVVTLPHNLDSTTTYHLLLNEVVEDITKRNKVPNLDFVFSVGSQIDTFSGSASIATLEGENSDNVLIALYADTVSNLAIKYKKPLYSMPAKSGAVQFNYLKPGKYRCFGLEDNNKNLIYDLPTEKIAFTDSILVIGPKQKTIKPRLTLFEEDRPLKIQNINLSNKSKIVVKWSKTPTDSVMAALKSANHKLLYTQTVKNITTLWHTVIADSAKLTLRCGKIDSSLMLYANTRDLSPIDFDTKDELNTGFNKSRDKSKKSYVAEVAAIGKPLILEFSVPLASLDTNLIICTDTTKKQLKPTKVTIQNTQVHLSFNLKKATKIKLQFNPNALKGLAGEVNKDTLKTFGEVNSAKFSELTCKVGKMKLGESYLVQVLTENTPIFSQYIQNTTRDSFSVKLPNLPATKQYQLKVVGDVNKNGQWDSGILAKAKQPEPLFFSASVGFKPNFDAVISLELKHEPTTNNRPKQ
jgi:hypothetical protein